MTTLTCTHELTHVEVIDSVDAIHTFPAYVCDDCNEIVDTLDGENY